MTSIVYFYGSRAVFVDAAAVCRDAVLTLAVRSGPVRTHARDGKNIGDAYPEVTI